MTGWALTGCVGHLSPSSADQQALAAVRVNLAQGYMGQGQWQEALRQIDAAVVLGPDVPAAWLARAEFYRQRAQPQAAEESYIRALRLTPQAGAANHHYAWYLCQTKDGRDEAMKYFDQALNDEAYAHRAQAQAHRQSCLMQVVD